MRLLSRLRSPLAPPRPLHRALLFAGGLLLLFLVVQLVPSSTPADVPAEVRETGFPEATRSTVRPERDRRDGYSLFSTGNLFAFVLLAGGAAWALHLRQSATPGGDAPTLFEPVGQMQLAPNQQLRLVRCGGEVLLLGVTAGQITLLQQYPADTFDGVPTGPAAASPMADFADLLRRHAARPSHA